MRAAPGRDGTIEWAVIPGQKLIAHMPFVRHKPPAWKIGVKPAQQDLKLCAHRLAFRSTKREPVQTERRLNSGNTSLPSISMVFSGWVLATWIDT